MKYTLSGGIFERVSGASPADERMKRDCRTRRAPATQ